MDFLNSQLYAVIMPGQKRLRDLIREIRSCRTAAEERSVVNRECAVIRDNFRDEDNTFRCRNVAKLLYIHMLGYPAHFGQLECLKLIASPKFTDKRIGYLGAMLLLDERTDVHLLVTNSLKNDLNHNNQYIASLALCTLGSICSTEMSRDLAGEVEKIIKSPNTYLRKKAVLCAFRIIRKVPDLIEMFIPCTRSLLADKSHGVILAVVTLISEMCETSPDVLNHFRKLVPALVRICKNMIMSGYSPDHDVNGVSDPFLQVKILRLLRILGRNDATSSDSMGDILAQVATNTETSKNVGHAILYEIVLTVMGTESETGLRVLAVNILGRFLLNNDKNIRYVALNTLKRVVHADYKAVQRHRTTIVECLKDPDISIRRRAMDLCFVLINSSNIRGMAKEMLLFLERCDQEFKPDVCSNIVISAEKYSPNKKWHIDTIMSIITTAGNEAKDDVVSSLISLISETPDLHSYAVIQLYRLLAEDFSQQPLVQCASWCIGEFGELLLAGGNCPDVEPITVSQQEVLQVLERPLLSSLTSVTSKEYLLTALIKLSTRLPDVQHRIQELTALYSTSTQVELQQRAVEFSGLFRQPSSLRSGVLERMPVLEHRLVSDAKIYSSVGEDAEVTNRPVIATNGSSDRGRSDSQSQNIFDLLDMAKTEGVGDVKLTEGDNQPKENKPSNDLLDLLGDLNVGGGESSVPSGTLINGNALDNINSLMSSLKNSTGGANVEEFGNKNSNTSQTVYNKSGLRILFDFEHSPGSPQIQVRLTASNLTTSCTFTDFACQVAVPKSFQLSMRPPSSTSLSPNGGVVTQILDINNPDKNPLRMRMRLQYSQNGAPMSDQIQLDSFPDSVWK